MVLSEAGVYLGSAAVLLLVLQPQAIAQSQQRGASQNIRITAHVKAFCRMGGAHDGWHGGVHIKGRADDGRYIDRRLGGHGHFNVICNTPYALHLHRWGSHHGWGGSRDDHGRGPRDLRVDNADDLNVLLHFASNATLLAGPCVVASTMADMGACLETAQAGETVFPPSRTLVRLAVAGRPAGIVEPAALPVIQPLQEVIFYPEDGAITVAGQGVDPFSQREMDDYIALSVSGRY
jgi:hypothetical protein